MTQNQSPRISFIIPTTGKLFELERCLRSIQMQDWPETDYEILLIANPPSAFVQDLPRQLKMRSCRVLSSTPQGVGRARNRGLRAAQGSILHFLDDDCVLPHKHHIRDVINRHRSLPNVDLLAGLYSDTDHSSFWERSYNSMGRLWLESGLSNVEALHCLGGHLSMKSSLTTRSLRFPEHLTDCGEEIPFLKEARDKGLRCKFVPDLHVMHRPGYDGKSFLRRAWRQGQIKAQFDHGHRPATRQRSRAVIQAFFRNPLTASGASLYIAVAMLGQVVSRGGSRLIVSNCDSSQALKGFSTTRPPLS